MKPLLVALLTALSLCAELPPIIDRSLLFGDPDISGAQLSPDGKYLSFVKPLDQTRNVWVKKAAEPFTAAKPVTAVTKRPVSGYFWSRDSKYILFVQDEAGDENFNVYAVNPLDAPKAGEKAPPARNITDAKKIRANLVRVARLDPDVIYVGLNDRDAAWHDLYKVSIRTGQRTLLRKNTDRDTSWVFDNNDQLRLTVRTTESGDTEIHRIDGDKLARIYSCTVFESCDPLRFHKDNARVFLRTNRGDPDLARLVLVDVKTSKEELVESDPLNKVDLTSATFSEVTGELAATAYVDDRMRMYWRDKEAEADFLWLQAKFPGRQIGRSNRTLDEQTWMINVTADTEPGETYIFQRKGRSLTLQYKIFDKLPRQHLAEMKAVSYKSSDGLEIHGYLTLPKGIAAKKLPVIVVPHGGPWARDFWGYHPMHQYLANRGYAVLSMNFRASTGYGKKFLNAGANEWGQKMQDDITWGVRHLIDEGIADPSRVGIMGGSYGGYATLAGVAFTPELYSAAVAIVAPSNLLSLLDSIPPYWEAGRAMFYKLMGDPRNPEGKKQLQRQSPLNSAIKIRTPLMVVQGANDPRVNKAEADQIVVALRDRNYPVKYLLAKDEGHGFAKPLNNLAMMTSVERFLSQYLGGRVQSDVNEEIANKLDELTVDVKKVTLPKKLEMTKAAVAKPSRALSAGVYSFVANISLGAQKISMKQTTEIKEDGGNWSITEKTSSQMGESVDTALLDRNSLAQRKRTIKQGPAAIEMTSTDSKISGSFAMGGAPKTFEEETGGPLFSETGIGFILGALPLTDDYEAIFRGFDAMKMKPKVTQLKVAGSEKVTVAAGTFDAFKVEANAEDGSSSATYWIDKATRKPVKMSSVLAQMGGATLVAELQ
ncbi:MAG: prolyl oligopeptidase family serine peptidase [Candidatus Solibacter usitatus]|nr:prolyl oligopeptidase family serine peptidase [Candidatus Solibacter usitatus]